MAASAPLLGAITLPARPLLNPNSACPSIPISRITVARCVSHPRFYNCKNAHEICRRWSSLQCRSSSAAAIETKQESQSQTGSAAPVLPFRVGHGFDLHRLEPGFPLIIGGITIPHDRGCDAHSDGDVLLHCIVDAILGALGLPDIGQLFPDTDPKWKGANSSVFIAEAVKLMREAGYELGNLDATLILQKPKISPHKEAIKSNVSRLLSSNPSVINIKAKTHEKVDSLGENRSVAAHTVILLMKK